MTRPTEEKRAQEAGTHSQRHTHDQEKTDRSRERDSESPSDSWISRKALVARLTPTASLATRVQQTQAREWLIKWSSMSECELLARLRERGKELIRKRVRDSPLLSLCSLHSRSLGLARKQEAEHGSSGCDRSSHEATGDRRRENENERERLQERETTAGKTERCCSGKASQMERTNERRRTHNSNITHKHMIIIITRHQQPSESAK